jgi:hypothetical protein
MENILAIALVLVGIALVVGVVRAIQKHNAESKEREMREVEKQIEETRKWREAQRATTLANAIANAPPRKKRTFVQRDESTVPPRGKETTVSYVASPTQSVNSYQDNFMSDMATAMVINSLLSSKHESQSGVVTEDRATGKVDVQVKESSWGFDDSDSRKSISSSMDTSSSWSSSDSSSSSSSDSGPSSDW